MTGKRQKPLEKKNLSGSDFVLYPVYKRSGPPDVLTHDDRQYDPRVDKKTDNPVLVTSIADQRSFSANSRPLIDLDLIVKAPQSDLYYIPEELSQFKEFLNIVIQREHKRSPAAFTQAAYLQIKQGARTLGDRDWHFDSGIPSRTYLVADNRPTIYATDVPLSTRDAWRARQKFNDAAGVGGFNQTMMLTYAFDRSSRALDEDNHRIFKPYDIVTHNGMTLHTGTPGAVDRTFVSLFYTHSSILPAIGYDVAHPYKPALNDAYSAPIDEAADRLAQYYKNHRLSQRRFG